MPISNRARYLRETLNLLLVQDYSHLELIISDNASKDETEEQGRLLVCGLICRFYNSTALVSEGLQRGWIGHPPTRCRRSPAVGSADQRSPR